LNIRLEDLVKKTKSINFINTKLFIFFMVSTRGIIIGILVMILGIFVIYTFTSPNFLFSIGVDIKTYNAIHEQWGFWGPTIGIAILISGLIAMGKFE